MKVTCENEVFYTYSQCFNKNQLIEFVFVKHNASLCIEIIAFCREFNFEAPRTYVDLSLLRNKFLINESLCIFQTTANDSTSKAKTELLNIICYIKSKLVVSENVNAPHFLVKLTAQTRIDVVIDKATNRLDVVYAVKPAKVSPLRYKFDSVNM
jgi:hypothetical protein